jgi:hypothetical protein
VPDALNLASTLQVIYMVIVGDWMGGEPSMGQSSRSRPQIAGSEAWAFLCSLWAFVREKATDVQRLWAVAQWRVRFSVVLLV